MGEIRRIKQVLAANGYVFVRWTSKAHELWQGPRGSLVIPAQHGTDDPRALRNLRAEAKRQGVEFERR